MLQERVSKFEVDNNKSSFDRYYLTSKKQYLSHITCFYYGQREHASYKCFIRKNLVPVGGLCGFMRD